MPDKPLGEELGELVGGCNVPAEQTTVRYGTELLLDLYDCDEERFDRASVGKFMVKCAELLGDETRGEIHYLGTAAMKAEPVGIDAVQMSVTSRIVVHTINSFGAVYVSLFSRKLFDADEVEKLAGRWFGAATGRRRVVIRG